MQYEETLEEKKLKIETQKYDLEQKKYELTKRSFYFDLIAKIAIPVALGMIAWATYAHSVRSTTERMTFDIDIKQKELRQREVELFLKQTDAERQRDALKSAFIQNNLIHITSTTPGAEQYLESLAKAVFPPPDVQDILQKIAMIRVSMPKPLSTQTGPYVPTSQEYKNHGMQFVRSGKFEQALSDFDTATLLNPSDPEAWNFKAYAEMRTSRNEAALRSVSAAINLRDK